MTNAEFNQLKTIAAQEICFDDEDIANQCTKVARLYQKYLSVYTTVLELYNSFKTKSEKMYGELFRHYKINDDVSWTTKGEVDSQVKSDPKYHKLTVECYRLEVILKFLEKSLTNIKDLSHNIRNYIEVKKLLSGRDF